MIPLIIVGCGGFGREVVSVVRAVNEVAPTYELLGCLDDSPAPAHADALARIGVPLLGGTELLAESAGRAQAVIGIGSPTARAILDARFDAVEWATLVHPAATIGADVELGAGTVIAPGARLSTAIVLGRHGQIDQNATVGHDCRFGARVRLNPQACVSGAVTLGDGVLIGANATVLQGLSVAPDAVVGAGAVVVRDVDPGVTVMGVPARERSAPGSRR